MFTNSEKRIIIETQNEMYRYCNVPKPTEHRIDEVAPLVVAEFSYNFIFASSTALLVLGKLFRLLGLPFGKQTQYMVRQIADVLERGSDTVSKKIFSALKLITKPFFILSSEKTHDTFVKILLLLVLFNSIISINGLNIIDAIAKKKSVISTVYADALNSLTIYDVRALVKKIKGRIPKLIQPLSNAIKSTG